MKYFFNCKSIEEVKQLYRTLAMLHHPDKGGDMEIMKEVNSEYERACKKQFFSANMNADEMNNAILDMEAYKEAINKVAPLEGITIELVGSWLWITGNTKPLASILKSEPAKFLWAKKKTDFSAWFFRTAENKSCNKGAKMSLDAIRTKYGSQVISNKNVNQLA